MPMDTDDVCVRVLTDVPHETRIRVRGSTEFKCWDHEEAEKFSYLCEYYRQSVLTWLMRISPTSDIANVARFMDSNVENLVC